MYDINKERGVKKSRYYFHVTPTENITAIKKNGIKANDEGHIFVFRADRPGKKVLWIASSIAAYQVGIKTFALFWIASEGITGKVIHDRVAEQYASLQRIIIQDKIQKKYVQLYGVYAVIFNQSGKEI